MFSQRTIGFFLLAVLAVLVFANNGEAAYRKPPFNGSIFGKRSGNGKLNELFVN